MFKLDDAQEDYVSHIPAPGVLVQCIPNLSQNVERSSAVLEALCYFGNRDVLPVFYEYCLKGAYIRDEKDGMVIDRVRDTLRASYVSCMYRDLTEFFASLVAGGKQEFASSWQSESKVYADKIASDYEDLEYYD